MGVIRDNEPSHINACFIPRNLTMAKRIFQTTGFTFTATSDSTIIANNSYMALSGGSTTQRIDLLEVYWGGLSTASTPHTMHVCRTVTPGTTTSALVSPNSDGPMDPATAALVSPPGAYTNCTTNPVPSAATTDARLHVGGNAFGGIVRWNAAPTQQWVVLGNTNPNVSLLRV